MIDAKHHLSNLLARIHCDGGHYESAHGTDLAVEHADVKVAVAYSNVHELLVRIVALEKERDEWKARCEFSFEQREKLTAERNEWQARCEFSFRARDWLTEERDAYANRLRAMAAAHKVERDMLKAALSDWIVANAPGHWIDNLRKERDALKDAARLALTALNRAVPKNARQASEQTEAIAALKAVL